MKQEFDVLVEHLLETNIFLEEAIELVEKRMIQGALEKSGGKQTVASKLLGIPGTTKYRDRMSTPDRPHRRVTIQGVGNNDPSKTVRLEDMVNS